MSGKTYDVVGIGNALVDVLANVDEAFIASRKIAKGGMHLIEAEEALALYDAMPPAQETSGGSAANTIAALASLGGKGGFIGKVANDQLGAVFAHDLKAQGVQFANGKTASSLPTGRSLILVTPDGERTMNTSLGCNTNFGVDDIDVALLASAKVVYLEGYLFDKPEAKAAFRRAAAAARAAGCEVALSLSDSFCVGRHRDDFLALIADDVDILFANQSEIAALYETTDFAEAVARVDSAMMLAVITCGADGALIKRQGETVAVKAEPVAKVVDLTGAGDAFAAGFLCGYTRGQSLAEAGRLGALAAAEVISHFGARPQVKLAEFVAGKGLAA